LNQELTPSIELSAVTSDGTADANHSRSVKMRGNRNSQKHGITRLRETLKDAGLNAIDRRTQLGRELAERREQIEKDAGGRDQLSQVKSDIVDRYLRTLVLIDSIDAFLFKQPSLVRKRSRSLYPIVQQRTALVDSALRLANAIGLDKKPPKPLTFAEILAKREAERAASAPPTSPSSAPAQSPHGATSPERSHDAVPFPIFSSVMPVSPVPDTTHNSSFDGEQLAGDHDPEPDAPEEKFEAEEEPVQRPQTWRDRLQLRKSRIERETSFEEINDEDEETDGEEPTE
jgi:hypothetical protein